MFLPLDNLSSPRSANANAKKSKKAPKKPPRPVPIGRGSALNSIADLSLESKLLNIDSSIVEHRRSLGEDDVRELNTQMVENLVRAEEKDLDVTIDSMDVVLSDSPISKRWLHVEPTFGVLRAHESADIILSIHVNASIAEDLFTGKEVLT